MQNCSELYFDIEIENHEPYPTTSLTVCIHVRIQGLNISPTTSYSILTKQAVTRGLLTKRVIPTLSFREENGSGSFVVVVLWLPVYAHTYQGSASERVKGWAAKAGNYQFESRMEKGTKVIFAHFATNLDNADMAFRMVLKQNLGAWDTLKWIEERDRHCRGLMLISLRMGWTQGEALLKAQHDTQIRWSPPASHSGRRQSGKNMVARASPGASAADYNVRKDENLRHNESRYYRH